MTDQETKDQIQALLATGDWHATTETLSRLKRLIHEKLTARYGSDAICFVRYAPEDKRILQIFEGDRKELIGSRWTHFYRSGSRDPERFVLVAILDETEEVVLRRETQQEAEDWAVQEEARIVGVFCLQEQYSNVTKSMDQIDFIVGRYSIDPRFWDQEEKR